MEELRQLAYTTLDDPDTGKRKTWREYAGQELYYERLKATNQQVELMAERDALRARVANLEEALDAIAVYGSDTLSGRVDGLDDRNWQREAVREMSRRARAALAKTL
jgi:hypothetical protein